MPKIANIGIFSVFLTAVSWESSGFPRNCCRKNTKNAETANVGDFRHVFASYRPLVAKLFHILVEEVISFEMSGLTSKSDKY